MKKKSSNKGMKMKDFLLVLLLIAMISILLTSIAYLNFSLLDVEKIEMDASFSSPNKVAFNLDPDKMHFGKIPLGGSADRSFDIQNLRNFPVAAKIYATGDLGQYSAFSDTNIVIGARESKRIGIKVYAPKDAEIRLYEGSVIIEVRWSPFAYFS